MSDCAVAKSLCNDEIVLLAVAKSDCVVAKSDWVVLKSDCVVLKSVSKPEIVVFAVAKSACVVLRSVCRVATSASSAASLFSASTSPTGFPHSQTPFVLL